MNFKRPLLSLVLATAAMLTLFVGLALAQDPIEIDLSQREEDIRIQGSFDTEWMGEVASGDVNNDGYDDFIIGAPSGNPAFQGEVFVFFGSPTFSGVFSGTDADLIISGTLPTGDGFGHSVGAGDVNGDGYDDILIGADRFDYTEIMTDSGAAFIIYGSNSLSGSIDLASESADVTIYGSAAYDRLGRSVASGDINDDDTADMIVGAYRATVQGATETGKVHVIFGGSSISATIELSNTNTPANLTLLGDAQGDWLGRSVSSGDVNSDGTDDLILGAQHADPGGVLSAGRTYVVFGSSQLSGTSRIGNTAGVILDGVDQDDRSGFYVASGDLNNDAYDDILISAYYADGPDNTTGDQTGEIYIVYGASSLSATIPLSTAADITVYAAAAGDRLGRSLSSGDINGDGYYDLVMGAPRFDPGTPARDDAGAVFVIYGAQSLSSTYLLSETYDIVVWGDQAGDEADRAGAVGDINGDGVTDILVGAVLATTGATDAGEAYVVFGFGPTAIEITPTADTITAGGTIAFTVTAQNAHTQTWDVTNYTTTYAIDPTAGGSWTNNTYTPEFAGTWTVTATHKGLTDNATLTITHGTATSIEITPQTENITAGENVTYTATASDAYSNTWDVTSATDFSIEAGANGSCTANVCSATTAGSWTVTADYNSLPDTATLDVQHAAAASIEITPQTENITAGENVTYTATASDAYSNTWDVTSATGFSIEAGASGSCTANICNASTTGSWTVTADYNSLPDTATLHVIPDGLSRIEISPDEISITAGGNQTYTATAFDTYNNSWDVTSATTFSIEAGASGSCTDNVCTTTIAGSWTVEALYGGMSDTGLLHVIAASPGTPYRFEIIAPASAQAGQPFQITIRALDQYENPITAFNDSISLSTGIGAGDISPDRIILTDGEWTGNAIIRSGGERTIIVTFNDTNKGQENITITNYQIFIPIVAYRG